MSGNRMTVTRVTMVGKESVTVPVQRSLHVGILNAIAKEVAEASDLSTLTVSGTLFS